MSKESYDNQKSMIQCFLSSIMHNILITGIAIPVGVYIWGKIINNGYSVWVNLIFFLWFAVFIVWIFLINISLLIKNETKIWKKPFALCISISIFTLSLGLLICVLNEPTKGTLSAYINEESTSIPNEIYINRGFPKWLSFLDMTIKLKHDSINNKFYTDRLIRCGTWRLFPSPADEFPPYEKKLYIKNQKPFKERVFITLHKKMGTIDFKTCTLDEKGILRPVEGAKIKISPEPYGFEPEKTTPCSMNLEIGIYTISFLLPGFEESIPQSKMIHPKETVTVDGELKRFDDSALEQNESNSEYQETGFPDSDETIIQEIEIVNLMEQAYLLSQEGDLLKALFLLKILADEHPESKQGEEAKKILKTFDKTILED